MESIAKFGWKPCLFVFVMAMVTILFADTIPGIPRVRQSPYMEWCWAASTLCLVKYYDPKTSETLEEVAHIAVQSDVPADEDEIPTVIETAGKSSKLDVNYLVKVPTYAEIKREADAKRPFIMLIRWNSGGYHCNVFCGYYKNDTTSFRFMDPMNGFVNRKWNGSGVTITGGKWERTFLVTSSNNAILTQSNNKKEYSDISIISNASHQITIHYNKPSESLKIATIFDASGACISKLTSFGSDASCTFPTPLASGFYSIKVASLERSGEKSTQSRVFSIVR